MKPGYIFYGIHNDFSFVGGGLRKGCHMLDARQWMGWGAKFLHIERKKNKRRSFPPALPLHTQTCAWLTSGGVHNPPYAKQNLKLSLSCCHTALRTCWRQFHCVALVWNWTSLVFGVALSSFIVWRASTSPPPSLQQAFCGMPPLTSQPFGAEWHAFWRIGIT